MTSFDSSNISPLHLNAEPLSMQDLNGQLKAHLKARNFELPSICFTKMDQAFVIWGLLSVVIFSFAQFSTLSWTTQAWIDGALTGVGLLTTSGLTWKLASIEGLRWVIYLWAALTGVGMFLTVYGIFCGVAAILSNLCLLWLGLCTLGYGAMAIGMRSHSFTAACAFHLISINALNHPHSWQFLTSGIVMALPLFFFSVVPWDMQNAEHDIPC
ncbi:MAG: hypothetical protein AAFV85_02845 [Cyanobacteria bacterium J06634_6]